ncbi:MAG: photosystem P840 reaction-center cytochrome c-551 [Chlorobiaceae bacterium]|nr:photosystem P840 reaction-center cytochrome c-551 [Chlorobiaceae bacterium]NTW11221.1 photosystem P840 reaction-center cytochrome c-551 [Chlorobiaceae bacterium]
MDNKSNVKLIALAICGAALMGGAFYGLSFLTGYQVPAPNISADWTPVSSFIGWFMLIFCASMIIRTLGRMSSRISDRWFLSFPLGALGIVLLMFVVLWLRPSGILLSTTGRTTTMDGNYIRSVEELKSFQSKAILSPNVPLAPAGFDFAGAKSLFDGRCNKCHTFDSVSDVFKSKYKKTGKIDIIVKRMADYPTSDITPEESKNIMMFLNEKL